MQQILSTSPKRLLFLFVFVLSFSLTNAQLARLSQRPPANGQGGWSTNGFSACGATTRDIFVEYNFCAPTPNGPCTINSACGANPYRMHFRLLRNGNQVANTTYTASQAWGNWPLYNFAVQPGVYQAEIRLELRSGFWPFCSWNNHQTTLTNTFTVTQNQALPNFNINGIPVPTNGSPINVCGSNIRVNAATTTCETRYMVSIQECDLWWNRTGQYEVDVWFNGQAPDNINLQQLANTYSQPPYFTGPSNRYNTGLFGGTLSNGQPRYYRVSICVNEPGWLCKTALIKVDGNCRAVPGPADVNVYNPIAAGNEGGGKANLNYDLIRNGDDSKTNLDTEPCTGRVIANRTDEVADGINNSKIPVVANQILSEAANGTTAKLSPNPAQSQVALLLNLKQETLVKVNIINAAGVRIRQGLVNRKLMPGQQNLPLDISDLKPGIYIVEIAEGEQVSKQKLVINQ
jgi:Secretion system C-terminal sorting domain